MGEDRNVLRNLGGGVLFLVESDTGGPLGLTGFGLFLLQAETGGADTALTLRVCIMERV